jgi:hypothetical protein
LIDINNHESIFAKKRSTLAAAIMLTSPGIPMIFQGQEMLETRAFGFLLEFPHATDDGSPFDLTTGGGEFLFGSRILVAPNPSPEEVAPYTVYLPPGTWYDYWSGEQFTRTKATETLDLEQRDKLAAQKPLIVTPKLEQLPVYVRGGSILPIAPLTQSTAEVPKGPLTLRVFPLALGLCGRTTEGTVA